MNNYIALLHSRQHVLINFLQFLSSAENPPVYLTGTGKSAHSISLETIFRAFGFWTQGPKFIFHHILKIVLVTVFWM